MSGVGRILYRAGAWRRVGARYITVDEEFREAGQGYSFLISLQAVC
jgi:hypothetical protein